MSSSVLEQVDSLAERLVAGGNVAIHGGPGSGKSHVADQIVAKISDISGIRVVRVDLSTCDTGTSVFEAVSRGLGGAHAVAKTTFDAWRALSTATSSDEGRLILFLEEFDSVLRFPDGDTFLRLIRELVHNPGRLHTSALIASRRTLRVLEEQVRGISTLEGVFAAEYARPLSPLDISLGWPSLSLDNDELTDLYAWSGGVAVLVSRRMELIRTGRQCGAVDLAARHEWTVRYIRYLDDLGLREAAAQYILGPVVERTPASHARLLAMSIVREAFVQSSNASPAPIAILEWFVSDLRAATCNLSEWGSRGRAEIAARRVTSALLSSLHNFDQDVVTLPAPGAFVVHEALTRAVADGICPASWGELVGFFRAGEFWIIIKCLWPQIASSVSPSDLQYWHPRFESLGGVGRSPGLVQVMDDALVARWAKDIESGFAVMRSSRKALQARALEGANERTGAADGNPVSTIRNASGGPAGAERAPRIAGEAPLRVDPRHRFSFWQVFGGTLAAVAAAVTVASFILTLAAR